MDSQQHGFQKDAMCRVDSICGCNIGDEGGYDNTANTFSSSINMGNIEAEGTGTVSILRVCDTDVSHQNRTDDLDLAKIPKAFIELSSRRINYYGKALQYFAFMANNDVRCQNNCK